MIPLLVSNINRTRYLDAWTFQQKICELRQSGTISDVLLLTEHENVFTLGKASNANHILASEAELKATGTDVFQIDRGGDVTYHGPGQIVAYPILDLNNYSLDIHWYLRSLEEVIIQALSKFHIAANREKEMTGVWVGGEKIAAIGVKVSRWVTMHGFALNVNTDLTKFDRIIPCGIFHKGVTSMKKILLHEIELEDVRAALINSFADIFKCHIVPIEKDILNSMIMNLSTQEIKAKGVSVESSVK